MNVQTTALIKEISQAAKASCVGQGSGRRFTVGFKQYAADLIGSGKLSRAMVADASNTHWATVNNWVKLYFSKTPKAIAVAGSPVETTRTVRASNVSIKSLEKRRIKAVEQMAQAKQDIEKIDRALAILDSLDLSAL